jgi:hypothetical protein
MSSGDAQRAAVDADPHAERLLDHVDVGVVLAEKIGEEPMVVEVEFERVFSGWLRNGCAKPRAVYSRGADPERPVASPQVAWACRVARIVALFAPAFKARRHDAQI